MRVFVAVEITNKSLLEKIKIFQSEIMIKAKPIESHNLHFTLMFLGEVSEKIIDDVKKRIAGIEFSSFEIKFVGVGAFPKPKFPRVVWLGVDSASGENLIKLAKKVENALEPLGFRSDKPFKPHLTVFRIKNKIGDITEQISSFNSSFGTQGMTELKLKKSVLTSDGPIYSDLVVVKAR